jgi:hypothetical protein
MEAKRDQALAKLYRDSGWTERELAANEGKSQTWIHFRLTFGRFLITSGNQTLPSDFTERRFRAYWEHGGFTRLVKPEDYGRRQYALRALPVRHGGQAKRHCRARQSSRVLTLPQPSRC